MDTLPDELRATDDYLGAMKVLDCDIFSRNLDGGFREAWDGVLTEQLTETGAEGPRCITRHHTPHGVLQFVHEEQTRLSTKYAVEDLVKDWQRDGRAYRWLIDHLALSWDREQFVAVDQQVGDWGLPLVPVGCSPLKRLHIDFGLDGACMFIADEPDEAQACCDAYWRKLRPVLERIAADDRVHAAIMMDNVDTPFYPPTLCERYWTPYVRDAASLFESHGKCLFVHACGQLQHLIGQFNAAGVHGLEGMAHPPLGDFEPTALDQLHDRFIYNGGFSAHEQTTRTDAEVDAFYESFFGQLKHPHRFMFAAACQTAINTPWPRIRRVVELCRQYAGKPVESTTDRS